MIKDYYKILEIEENFTEDLLKKKYRDLSKKYHPDINPSGADKFKEISEAYDVLSDPQKRQSYDFERKGGFSGQDDLFSQFFNQGQRRNVYVPLEKLITLKLTPIEIYLGKVKEIVYNRNIPCDECNGTRGSKRRCGECNGSGQVLRRFGSGFFVQQMVTSCPSCSGIGEIIEKKCFKCSGSGVKGEVKTITIELPNNIDNGQFLKLSKLGDFDKVDFGDLVLKIEVVNADGFSKMGNDLIYTLFLHFNEVHLNKYTIPHPLGSLSITAPNVFDTSIPLRVPGKGYNGGNLYIKREVKFTRD